jgi:hypothetical protein
MTLTCLLRATESVLCLEVTPENLAGIKNEMASTAPGQSFSPGTLLDDPLRLYVLHSMFPPLIAKTHTGTGEPGLVTEDVDTGIDDAMYTTGLLCHFSSPSDRSDILQLLIGNWRWSRGWSEWRLLPLRLVSHNESFAQRTLGNSLEVASGRLKLYECWLVPCTATDLHFLVPYLLPISYKQFASSPAP